MTVGSAQQPLPPSAGASAGRTAAGRTSAESLTLSGVIASGGWPVGAATVTVVRGGQQAGRGATDDNGRFSIELPAAGAVTVIVAAAGHAPLARSVSLGEGPLDLGVVSLDSTTSRPAPPKGTWTIDPVHSTVRATARHLALSCVEGRFREFSGVLQVEADPSRSRVEVDIVAASIDTGNADRDAHLRSPDFLDTERFPMLTYRSTAVQQQAADRWTVSGLLTLRDISRDVPLQVSYLGTGPDPWGGTRSAFVGTAELARRDYEMNWNMGLPSGLVVIGPTLRVDLEVQALLTAD